MQDRTIDNALLALRRQGGSQAKLADVILELRGIPLPVIQNEPMRRGEAARLVLNELKRGPVTCPQIADLIAIDRPDLPRRYALHRAYMALKRLEAKGLVWDDKPVWRLAR